MTKKLIVGGAIVAGVSAVAYFANNKSKKHAIMGGVLGLIVAALAIPKLMPAIEAKPLIVKAPKIA